MSLLRWIFSSSPPKCAANSKENAERIDILKHLSSIHRSQFDIRQKLEWRIIFTALSFYVLVPVAITSKQIHLQSDWWFILPLYLLFTGSILFFLTRIQKAHNQNKLAAEMAEDILWNMTEQNPIEIFARPRLRSRAAYIRNQASIFFWLQCVIIGLFATVSYFSIATGYPEFTPGTKGGIVLASSPSDLLRFLQDYPASGAIIGAVITALVNMGVLFGIASRYTKRLKRIESTLEFSKRFQDLLQQQRDLNRRCSTPPTTMDIDDADTWWWRFFDLQLYEFDFFQQGLVRRERFLEWMKWRWYDYKAAKNAMSTTCGVDYKEGWQSWKNRPAMKENRLVRFLDAVHNASNVQEIASLVKKNAPRWWQWLKRLPLD
jgi:hypothetical protein